MRYSRGHKEETRKRIVDVAGRRFRREGIEAVGLVPLMKEAGLTHGAFYAHFPSKDALVAEAVQTAFADTNARLAAAADRAPDGQRLEALLDGYLSEAHRDVPETGCTAAALAGELSRATPAAREAFAEGFANLVALVERHLPDNLSAEEGHRRALAIASTMIGSLALARTLPDRSGSAAILCAARENALAIARR